MHWKNLGLHSILGFMEGFNAQKFCHKCLISKDKMCDITLEKDCEMRSEEKYEELVALNNPKVSAIKSKCLFHAVKNFHCLKNVTMDPMHGILEGVTHYYIASILHHFIYVKKRFTLDELNFRIRGFDYGYDPHVNEIQNISETRLKNGCLILSSSEMKCLITN